MSPIDKVWGDVAQLASAGWDDLFERIGIDVESNDPAGELERVVAVDRDVPGFGDFATDFAAFVEPGDPTRSLLFHAFASPNVGVDADTHPTLEQIDTLENYVYAAGNASIEDVAVRAAGALGLDPAALELAIATFAVNYRPEAATPHGKYADLCFSRTGVARVGTDAPAYVGPHRAFSAHLESDDARVVRVIPCRYSAYLAVRAFGDIDRFGPLELINSEPNDRADRRHRFWVPIHKLFEGTECLRGEELTVIFSVAIR